MKLGLPGTKESHWMLNRLPVKADKANMSLISNKTSKANRMDQDMAVSGRGNDKSTAVQTPRLSER
jgi:hypothetical protein